MNPAVQLAAFGAALALLTAGAFAVGAAVGPANRARRRDAEPRIPRAGAR